METLAFDPCEKSGGNDNRPDPVEFERRYFDTLARV